MASIDLSQPLDLAWLESQLLGKPKSKIIQWFSLLQEEECATVGDLAAFVSDPDAWSQLRLPLVVKAHLRNAVPGANSPKMACNKTDAEPGAESESMGFVDPGAQTNANAQDEKPEAGPPPDDDVAPPLDSDDFYTILGVPADASAQQLKAAFRSKCLQYHPDKHPDKPWATRAFQLINTAYETLSDPVKRPVYDQKASANSNKRMGSKSDGGAKSMRKDGASVSGARTHLFLVVGETGSGKSTLINVVANYHLGGHFHNDVKAVIPSKFFPVTHPEVCSSGASHSEANVKDQSKSQTTESRRYTFTKRHTFCYIDTPGFGDTDGVERDENHLDTVLRAAEDAGELHGVMLVVNGRAPRYTEHLHYVLTKLRCNLPDVVMDNFVVVMTNSSELTATFPMDKLQHFKPRHVFYMDNTFFHKDPVKLSSGAVQEAQKEWGRSMQTVECMERELSGLTAASTDAFKTLRNQRFSIKQQMHASRGEFEKLQVLLDTLQQRKAEETSFGKSAQSFANYTTTKVIKVPVTKSGQKTTTCSVCSFACHPGCSLQEVTSTGTNHFSGCWAIRGDRCHQCPGRCHHTKHYHARSTTTYEDKTVDEVLQDVKANYDQAMQSKQSAATAVASAEGAVTLVRQAIAASQQKVVNSMHAIKKIASSFNLVHEMQSELNVLRRVGQGLTTPQARVEHDNMIGMIEEQLTSLSSTP